MIKNPEHLLYGVIRNSVIFEPFPKPPGSDNKMLYISGLLEDYSLFVFLSG
jgi:hypothetical protein